MSLEEFENTPDPKTKRYILMRSITDFGMGFIYVAVGVIIFFAKQFNLSYMILRRVCRQNYLPCWHLFTERGEFTGGSKKIILKKDE